jgi:hypothetical protein
MTPEHREVFVIQESLVPHFDGTAIRQHAPEIRGELR